MSDLIYHKILHVLELTCPLFKHNLITQSFIVGSVAKGTTTQHSDIDIYLINPLFNHQFNQYNIELPPTSHKLDVHTKKITDKLKQLNAEPHYIAIENKLMEEMWFWKYKNELIHFMYDYESESITKSKDEHMEITKDFCEMIKHFNY